MSKKVLSFIALATLGVTLWGCSSNSSKDKDTSSKSTAKSEKVAKNKKVAKKDKGSEKKEVSSSESTSGSENSASQSSESNTTAASSSDKTNSSSNTSQAANIKPFGDDPNLALAVAAEAFETAQRSYSMEDIDPSSGPQSDGSYILKIYSGAKGLDVYTLKPLPDNKVSVNAKYGSVQGGEFQDAGTKTVERPY